MKKKNVLIVVSILVLIGIGVCIANAIHKKTAPTFDEFADSFEKSAEEVLGEDIKKVSKTELAATLTYGDQNDEDNNIYYRILKTKLSDMSDNLVNSTSNIIR